MIDKLMYDGRELKEIIPDIKERIVILVFSSQTCQNCQRFWSEFSSVEAGLNIFDVSIVEVDIEKYPHLGTQYAITGTPTFLLIAEGDTVGRITGFESAGALTSKIRQYFYC